jgi:hypothetical protein
MAEKLLTVRKDPYDDMIFHLYVNHSKNYPDLHCASMHNDTLISLVPEKYIEELRDLKCGEEWDTKIRFVLFGG